MSASPYVRVVNQQHLDILGTDEWRQTLEERVFPFAFGPLGPDALGGDVLEVGPGPGMTTDLLRARVSHLTSIELDPDLASALRTRLAGSNVEVIDGDGTAMPFDDRRFSGVVMFTMLHHVPTVELQDAMFGEVARVLQPGGLFVASDGVARDELAALHHDDIYNPVDPASLEARLTTAGFREIEIEANSLAWACRART
jgi:SAM-dependent methyltransferase